MKIARVVTTVPGTKDEKVFDSVMNVAITVDEKSAEFITDSTIALAKTIRDVFQDNPNSDISVNISNHILRIPEFREIRDDLYYKGITKNQF